MRDARPLLGAAGALAGSTLMGAVTGAGFWMVAAHTFGDAQVGLASTAVAALTLVALVCAQPLNITLLTRLPRVADDPATATGAVTAAALTSGGGAAALGAVAAAVLPRVLDEPAMGSVWVVGSVVVAAVTQAVGIVLDGAAVAVRAGRVSVARNGLHGAVKLVGLGGVAVLVAAVGDRLGLPVPASGLAVTAWAVAGVVSVVVAARSLRGPLGGTWPGWERVRAGGRVLRRGVGAQMTGVLAGSAPAQVLPLVVAGGVGAAGAAAFSLSWMVAGLLFMVSAALCSAALTTAASTSTGRWRLLGWGHAGVLTVGIGGAFLAGPWVMGVAGLQDTATGGAVLRVLAVAGVGNAAANMAVAALRICERLGAVAGATVAGAVVTLVVVTPAVHSWGVAGAGVAWGAGQVVCAVAAGAFLLTTRRRRPVVPVESAPAAKLVTT